jgi:hypothetical protein
VLPQLAPQTILQQDGVPPHFCHLKACVKDAVATVTPTMLEAMWNEVEYRLDICHATMRAHIEIN